MVLPDFWPLIKINLAWRKRRLLGNVWGGNLSKIKIRPHSAVGYTRSSTWRTKANAESKCEPQKRVNMGVYKATKILPGMKGAASTRKMLIQPYFLPEPCMHPSPCPYVVIYWKWHQAYVWTWVPRQSDKCETNCKPGGCSPLWLPMCDTQVPPLEDSRDFMGTSSGLEDLPSSLYMFFSFSNGSKHLKLNIWAKSHKEEDQTKPSRFR